MVRYHHILNVTNRISMLNADTCCWRCSLTVFELSRCLLSSLSTSLKHVQFLLDVVPLGPPPLLCHLLPCLKGCFHLGLQDLIIGWEFKANVCKNQGTMDETEITLTASIWVCVVSGRGRMAGLELVLLAWIYERVGVVAVSTKLSPNQYRPCFLPPPALMTTS